MEYTNEFIKELFETSKTQKEVFTKLGKKNNGSAWRLVRKLAQQINLDLKEYNRKMSKEKYSSNTRFCKFCGKELTYKQRNNLFCSHSCSASFNNKNTTKSIETRRKISETLQKTKGKSIDEITYNFEHKNIFCLNCGKELTKKQSYNKFCCHKCSRDYKYKEIVKKIIAGENITKGGNQIPNVLKKYLMEIHDNKCQKCGWSEEHPITHKIPLEVHHLDGDCTNNNLENLQLLCPNCHSLTENFGSLNKNSKRFHRKKATKQDLLN